MNPGDRPRHDRFGRVKPAIDPQRPLGLLYEYEPAPGQERASLTVFMAGAECPFECVFCDLGQHTLVGATPPGALPRQLAVALERLAGAGHGEIPELAALQIKLYNASNFFEPRAVPRGDLPVLARALQPFGRVVVESHPRTIQQCTFRFAELLAPALEVAMGLETAHPRALEQLRKSMTLADFERAARRLRARDISVRAFVLIGVPFVAPAQQAWWVGESVRRAAACGATTVALIPLRALPSFSGPELSTVEDAVAAALEAASPGCAVLLDGWDLERYAADPDGARRVLRLRAHAARVVWQERCQ